MPRLHVAGRRRQQPHHGRADRAPPRHRRAAAPAAAPLRERTSARRPLPHRAPRRLGRAGHPHGGSARRRPLSDLRVQDVRHQRPRGQHLRAAGPHRPVSLAPPSRHVLLHRRKGRAGPRGGEVDRQARLQGRGHRGAGLRRLPLPGRQPGRRRGGPRLQAGDVRPRGRPHQYRGAGGRGRAGGTRRGHSCRDRPARAAGRAGRHRHPRGVGTARHLLGRRDEGPRRALRPRGGDGQAPRLGGGAGGGGGGHEGRRRAGPAGLRPGGAPLPRRAADDHRRGHQRDPAPDHLQEPARALRRAAGRAHLARRLRRRAAPARAGGPAGGGQGRGAGGPGAGRGTARPGVARGAAGRAGYLRRARRSRAWRPGPAPAHRGHDRRGGGARLGRARELARRSARGHAGRRAHRLPRGPRAAAAPHDPRRAVDGAGDRGVDRRAPGGSGLGAHRRRAGGG